MSGFKMGKSLIQLAKDVLFHAFQAAYEEAHGNLKNSSSYFVETVLAKMDHRGTLDDMFEHFIEKCTKSSDFLDVCTSCANNISVHTPHRKISSPKDREEVQQSRCCWKRTSSLTSLIDKFFSSVSFVRGLKNAHTCNGYTQLTEKSAQRLSKVSSKE